MPKTKQQPNNNAAAEIALAVEACKILYDLTVRQGFTITLTTNPNTRKLTLSVPILMRAFSGSSLIEVLRKATVVKDDYPPWLGQVGIEREQLPAVADQGNLGSSTACAAAAALHPGTPQSYAVYKIDSKLHENFQKKKDI